jgi:hypothetical protein
MWVEIRLTSSEMMAAATVGVMRRVGSLYKQMDTNRHAPHSSWATDIDGAAAEMAVSKYLGRYWGAHTKNFHGKDVEGGIQVRSTTRADGHLIIRETDKEPEDIFVLVFANAPTYVIQGCIACKLGKTDKYFREGNGTGSDAWWIPRNQLEDLVR